MSTVRDATFELLRRLDLTPIFSNPGSTEIPFLSGLPEDLPFLLGLHEGAVVGMASGYALGRRRPSFVLLHTTAGLGNAVNAIATARVNRTPLVIAVGQQDRRHLAQQPFLAGRLAGLAGDYPVSFEQPVRAQDVPGALARAWHAASMQRGPAIVVVPMDDWLTPAGQAWELAAPDRLLRPEGWDDAAVGALAELLDRASAPALVAGAGNDTAEGWAALVALAERLDAPVWQEAFSAGAGFPQDHRLFAGQLPPARAALRDTLAGRDVVLAVGAPVFRQYGYEPGPLVIEGTQLAILTDDPAEAERAPVDLAVVASPAAVCARLAERVAARPQASTEPLLRRPAAASVPGAGEPLSTVHVLSALAERLPPEVVLVEEAPSARPELELRLPARRPLGFVSAAMGGLGWGLPASAGLRLALPERPVVAVLGDGATLFGVHGLWSAGRYGAGVLYVVLKNGGYGVMDELARAEGAQPVWPSFAEVDVTALARALGCDAQRIERHDDLMDALEGVLPELTRRRRPLLLEVVVEPATLVSERGGGRG